MTLRTSTARPSSTSGAVVEPSWKNLLPELLLALLGCSGGAFVYEAVDIDVRDVVASDVGRAGSAPALKDSRLVLSDLVDWVSDAEREQLNRLVRLGRYYSWLVEYAMELTGWLWLVRRRRRQGGDDGSECSRVRTMLLLRKGVWRFSTCIDRLC